MDRSTLRKLGGLWTLAQGVVLAVVPRLHVAIVRRVLGLNFEGADELTATPEYVRDLRVSGLALVAAGGTALLVEELLGGVGDGDGGEKPSDGD